MHPSTFVHGDSPATGQVWSSQGVVSFDKMKVTNNRSSLSSVAMLGQVCLHSMHKYVPRIHVQKVENCSRGQNLSAAVDDDGERQGKNRKQR
jgi:hypothetical protein